MGKSIVDRVVEEMNDLSQPRQREVLEFVHSLKSSTRKGIPGRDLLRFAGTISPEDADLMRQAIEEGCERVDADGW